MNEMMTSFERVVRACDAAAGDAFREGLTAVLALEAAAWFLLLVIALVLERRSKGWIVSRGWVRRRCAIRGAPASTRRTGVFSFRPSASDFPPE